MTYMWGTLSWGQALGRGTLWVGSPGPALSRPARGRPQAKGLPHNGGVTSCP
jgi:hypothetical protein